MSPRPHPSSVQEPQGVLYFLPQGWMLQQEDKRVKYVVFGFQKLILSH